MIPLCDLHAEYLACKQPIDEAIARVIENSSFILGEEVKAFEEEVNSEDISCWRRGQGAYLGLEASPEP